MKCYYFVFFCLGVLRMNWSLRLVFVYSSSGIAYHCQCALPVSRAPHTAFAEVMHYSCKGEISPYFGDGIDLLFKAVYLSVTLHLFSISLKKPPQQIQQRKRDNVFFGTNKNVLVN